MDVGLWLLLVFLNVFRMEVVVSSVPPLWMWVCGCCWWLFLVFPPCGCGSVVVAGVSECFSDGGGCF